MNQLYKVSTSCIGDHQFNEEELDAVGELSKHVLSYRPEIPVIGAHRQTLYSVVCERAGKPLADPDGRDLALGHATSSEENRDQSADHQEHASNI